MHRNSCSVYGGWGHSRRAPGGFTLLELLVVIAIITILALLLIPAMSTLSERYREVACQSNLRQLTIASFNFSAEQGRLPGPFWSPYAWVSVDWNWTVWSATNAGSFLYPYVKDQKTYLCPTFYLMVKDLPDSTMGGPNTGRTYSMNYMADSLIIQVSSMREPAAKVFYLEENPSGATYIGGVQMGGYGLNDGGCNIGDGGGGRDCPGTFHRLSSCMSTFFDGHGSRFIMDRNLLWTAKFRGN